MESSYWTRRMVSRRAALRGAGIGVAGLAGAALVGCGGDDDDDGGATATAAPGGGTAAPTSAPTEAPAAAPKPGGTLKMFTNLEPDTWDVQKATSYKTAVHTTYVYSRLFRYVVGDNEPASGNVEGDLVESWTQPDELTYNLNLRKGVKWDQRSPTSGREFVAEDVVLSWEKFSQEASYRKTLSNAASPSAPIASIEAVDDNTIRMKLAHPDALVLPIMAWYLSGLWIHPKESMNGGFDPAKDTRGTGPWILESHEPAVGFKYVKNPDWHFGPDIPYVDRIDLPVIEDTAQAEVQFRAKNIFIGGPLAQNYPIVVKEVDGTEIVTGAPATAGSGFGMNRIPESGFNDPRVRKALSMSLDRDTFIDVINEPAAFEDVGVNLTRYWNSPLSPAFGAMWLDPKGPDAGPGGKFLEHNVAEAKALLSAAGYDDSKPFEFDLIFPGARYGRDWPTRAETWQAMASDAGIKAHLWVVDYTTEWIAKPPAGVFRTFSVFEGRDGRKSAVTYRPNGGRSTPGEWFNTFFQSTGANNEVGDHWPELDQLITDARVENDFEARVAKVHDIQRFMMENMVTIPAFPQVDGTAIKWSGLQGPGRWRGWGGGVSGNYNAIAEVYPLWWLEDSLRS